MCFTHAGNLKVIRIKPYSLIMTLESEIEIAMIGNIAYIDQL